MTSLGSSLGSGSGAGTPDRVAGYGVQGHPVQGSAASFLRGATTGAAGLGSALKSGFAGLGKKLTETLS